MAGSKPGHDAECEGPVSARTALQGAPRLALRSIRVTKVCRPSFTNL
jgi:hypothetical protein